MRSTTTGLLTYAQVGEQLGVGVDCVRALVARGQLRSVPVGERYRRVTRAELDRYITNLDRATYGLPPLVPSDEVQRALRLVEETA